jgi:DNA-3-methyladenine glycosylase I
MAGEKIRCGWCQGNALYEAYHDNEWGRPTHNDATLFKFILPEGFQAGLSWITILRRRESFAKAFDNFGYKNCPIRARKA